MPAKLYSAQNPRILMVCHRRFSVATRRKPAKAGLSLLQPADPVASASLLHHLLKNLICIPIGCELLLHCGVLSEFTKNEWKADAQCFIDFVHAM